MESLLNIQEILEATGGKAVAPRAGDVSFTRVATDSRAISSGSLFVPLIGEKQDGHKYIGQAVAKGASVVLASRQCRKVWQSFLPSPACIIEVDNTLHALQQIARKYIDKFTNLIKIGITGSNGKTTTKEMIARVLKEKYNTVYTEGNLNSETGVPLSVFSLLGGGSITPLSRAAAVFEMGMNRTDEIGESAAVVRPQKAVIINIGTAHIGILGSKDAIAQEKRKILLYADEAFIPYNDDYASFLMEGTRGQVHTFGENDITLSKDMGLEGMDVIVGKEPCHIYLAGAHNLMNASAAVSLGRAMGIGDKEIAAALSSLRPIEGRLAWQDAALSNGCVVRLVQDYYNANPQSMSAAISICDNTPCRGKRIYVLGDMRESNAEASHRKLGRDASLSKASMAIFVGKDVHYAYEEMLSSPAGKSVHFVEGEDNEAMKKVSAIILDSAKDGDLLLLKASRSIMLERVETMVVGGK